MYPAVLCLLITSSSNYLLIILYPYINISCYSNISCIQCFIAHDITIVCYCTIVLQHTVNIMHSNVRMTFMSQMPYVAISGLKPGWVNLHIRVKWVTWVIRSNQMKPDHPVYFLMASIDPKGDSQCLSTRRTLPDHPN